MGCGQVRLLGWKVGGETISTQKGKRMSLDALLEPAENVTQPCKVGRIVAALPEPYKGALVKLLETPFANGGESDALIRNRMFKAGYPCSQAVIYRHRQQQCSCEGVVVE